MTQEIVSLCSELIDFEHQDGDSVAIRSSATVEDLPETSFAGLFRTFLGVSDMKSLLAAIKECWASLYHPRVIAYIHDHGLSLGPSDLRMGVIIQEMVKSDVSGVVFTIDPIRKRKDIVIVEANWGLGDTVVSGIVTPDTYYVDKDTLKTAKRNLGSKRRRTTISERGITYVDTPDSLRKKFCLSSSILEKIVRVSIMIEKHFLLPQDIEWTIQGRNLFIVQARPITAI